MQLSEKERKLLLTNEEYRNRILGQIKEETLRQEFKARIKTVLNFALIITAFLAGMTVSVFMDPRKVLIIAPLGAAVIVIPLLYAAYRWGKYTR